MTIFAKFYRARRYTWRKFDSLRQILCLPKNEVSNLKSDKICSAPAPQAVPTNARRVHAFGCYAPLSRGRYLGR
nr:hypothetical protein [uncultured Campylobacter sp.]